MTNENDTMPDLMFRALNTTELDEFQQWAVDNWEPGKPVKNFWHPVVRETWAKLEAEHCRQQAERVQRDG